MATENLWPSESSSLHQILLERRFRCLLEIPISCQKIGDLFLTFPTCEIVYIKNVHLLSWSLHTLVDLLFDRDEI